MTTKFDNQSWYSISEYLKDKFGSKVVKLALDGNFTCPNRDGKKGFGGCTFCSESGSGEFSSNDMQKQISLLKNKWPVSKYIAYFQSHTNTYADVNKGIAQVGLKAGIPVLFGVITTENIEQAIERAGTKAGNKGYDVACSAIEMINLIETIG